MYNFTIIDEASKEIEHISSQPQEIATQMVKEPSKASQGFIKSTVHFLHRYLEQPNCIRIYISKN